MPKIGFIGAGTVGTALAISLAGKGYRIVAVSSRSKSSAERLAKAVKGCFPFDSGQEVVERAELIFVTTPDDVIGQVVAGLSWRPGKAVLHCSGAASLDILEPARIVGAEVGGFHPLQSFANTEEAIKNLPGSAFALEAEEPLLSTLKEMAEALGGTWVELGPGDKVLYHVAAVMVSNYTVALMKMATDLWREFGKSTPEATQALLPLLKGTVNNIAKVGLPNCLTGPIARGDVGTIGKHLQALKERFRSLLPAYQELGLQDIPVALAKGGIDEGQAAKLRELLMKGGSGGERCA